MPSSVRAIARRAFIVAVAGALAIGSLPATAASTVDELIELNLRAWGGETELLAEVYAPDGVHTATFYDRTTEYAGPDEVAMVAGRGVIEPVGPRVDLPAADGEWRWVSFNILAGGTACLWHAVDGQIARHDCLVPERSADSAPHADVVDDDAAIAAIDEIGERLDSAWGPDASVEALAAAYAPDGVHSARFLNRTRSYSGPEEILRVARGSTTIEDVGPRIIFETSEGELAWAQVNSLAGGSVCLFHAVDGMVTRHDCIVPTTM